MGRSAFLFCIPHPQPLSQDGRGEPELFLKVPLPKGERFRVRGMAVV